MKNTYLVTGATKGIGKAISDELSLQGHHVIGIARNIDHIDFPGQLFSCDLSNIEQTEETLALIAKSHVIHGIVNNSGISLPQSLGQISFLALEEVWNLNVRAAIQVTQHFVAQLKEQRFGRIINIGSRAIYGAKQRTAYSAAKSALVGCTKTWALELAEFGITVNCIAPGPIETELLEKLDPLEVRLKK